LLPFFVSLFKIVFDSGCIPESWSEGSIVPIYKNKLYYDEKKKKKKKEQG
jgi:hypothetical protein